MSDDLIRIEKKLDEVLKLLLHMEEASHGKAGKVPYRPAPLKMEGQVCSLCQRPVRYLPSKADSSSYERQCGCSLR